MIDSVYYTGAMRGKNTALLMFDSYYNYVDFINESKGKVTGIAKSNLDYLEAPDYVQQKLNYYSGNKWFGTQDADKVTGQIDTFLFNTELDEMLESFRSETVQFDITDIDQKKKITFTSQEIGLFSFDLASLGLIRVFEYYSPLLNEIVDGKFIKAYKTGSGDKVFYHIEIKSVPRHKVTQLKKDYFYSDILNARVDKKFLDEVIEDERPVYYYREVKGIPRHDVVQKQKINPSTGRPMFTTTHKKSFIYIPKVVNPLPRIDIIINTSFDYTVDAEKQMIWGALSAIVLAEKLNASSVDFRIFASYPTELNNKKKIFGFVKIKDSNQALNINSLAILTADARNFRLQQFKAWMAMAGACGFENDVLNRSLGYAITQPDEIKENFIEYLKKTNDFDDGKEVVPEAKIVFTQALTRQAGIDQYNDIVKQISEIKTS